MKYLDAIAGIFWSWWHGGEALSSEAKLKNLWAVERKLSDALIKFRETIKELSPQEVSEIPSSPAERRAIKNEASLVCRFAGIDIARPEFVRETAYQAIVWSNSIDHLVSPFEVMKHIEMKAILQLIFGLSCYACRYPEQEIPIGEEDFYLICNRINERLNGYYETDAAEIGDLAQRILELTPEGIELNRLQNESKTLPPIQELG